MFTEELKFETFGSVWSISSSLTPGTSGGIKTNILVSLIKTTGVTDVGGETGLLYVVRFLKTHD